MLVSLTRPDGGNIAIDPDFVAEINRVKPPYTWVCFKGGSNQTVLETVDQLAPLFVPPMIRFCKIDNDPVLVAADCLSRVNEGDFRGKPCVWLEFHSKHKRRHIAIINPFADVKRLLAFRQSA